MSQPVLGQLRQFLLAAVLGGGLAVFSTLLRAVRLLRPRLTHLCDALFGLVLTPALLLLALYAGAGRFRLFFVPALALGAAVFALPLGKPAERLFTALFRLAGRFLRRLGRLLFGPVNFFWKIAKKIFSFLKKSVMMDSVDAEAEAAAPKPFPGGSAHEVPAVVPGNEAHHPPARRRRRRHASVAPDEAPGPAAARRRT